MGVDDDALRAPELGGDDVRRLAGDTRKPRQLLERARDHAVELLEQHAHRPADRLGLLPVEARREDVPLELLLRNRQVVLRPVVLLEQRRGDAVHVHVGRLRGEHHRDEELERGAERERDRRVLVLAREAVDDLPHPVALPAGDAATRLRDEAAHYANAAAASLATGWYGSLGPAQTTSSAGQPAHAYSLGVGRNSPVRRRAIAAES